MDLDLFNSSSCKTKRFSGIFRTYPLTPSFTVKHVYIQGYHVLSLSLIFTLNRMRYLSFVLTYDLHHAISTASAIVYLDFEVFYIEMNIKRR